MKIICSSPKTKLSFFTSSPSTFGKVICGVLNSSGQFSQSSSKDDEIELVFNFKPSKTSGENDENNNNDHHDRDLIRRNLDTATTSLHPSIDPVNIRLEFSSTSSSSFSIFINKGIVSLQKYPQYSICGNVFLLPSLVSSSSYENETTVTLEEKPIESSQDLYQKNAQKLIKSVYKNRIKTTTHENNNNHNNDEPSPQNPENNNNNNNKQLWSEACEMTRLLYPMKGNGEVILEPNGVLLGDVAVVGKCSKFLYFGVKNDEEVQERIAVIGWAPHGDLFNDDDVDEDTIFSVKKHAPRSLISFEFLENGSPSSLPRPLHEISWIAGNNNNNNDDGNNNNNNSIVTAQVVTYRILLSKQDPRQSHFHQQELAYHTRNSSSSNSKNDSADEKDQEGQNTDWIQKFQLEDSHILSLNKSTTTTPETEDSSHIIAISSIKQTVHQLHKYITIQGKARGGMSALLGNSSSSTAKQLLKRMCDPKYSFTFLDKRDLNKERRNLDSLFLSTLGSSLVSGGGVSNNNSSQTSVRVLLNNNNNKNEFHLQNSDETQQVEFKQQLHQYNNSTTTADGNSSNNNNNNSKANIERARRILAAFANTRGGLLFVGVNDDGDLVGIADENNKKDEEILPRSTGFIPSMITNSVSHVKLKFPQNQNSSSTATVKPTAALDWWKKKPTTTTTAPSSMTPSTTTTTTTTATQQQQTSTNINSKAVHVMAVLRGAAPFYSTPGPAAPPVRGQASTLLLSVTCMAERLCKELKKLASSTTMQQNENGHDDSRRRERDEQQEE